MRLTGQAFAIAVSWQRTWTVHADGRALRDKTKQMANGKGGNMPNTSFTARMLFCSPLVLLINFPCSSTQRREGTPVAEISSHCFQSAISFLNMLQLPFFFTLRGADGTAVPLSSGAQSLYHIRFHSTTNRPSVGNGPRNLLWQFDGGETGSE